MPLPRSSSSPLRGMALMGSSSPPLLLAVPAVLHHEPVAAGLFRLVQSQVRGLVQPLELLAPPGQVHPHAGGEVDGFLVPQGQRELPADLRGLLPHQLLGELPAEEGDELIAPQPAHHLLGPEDPGEDLGRLPDGLVPGPVAQGVVHLLEVVQVHDEQGAGVLRAHGLQPLLDALLHGGPVQKPGKGVLGGLPLQLPDRLVCPRRLSVVSHKDYGFLCRAPPPGREPF